MKKFHIAIATNNIGASIKDYSIRLGCEPCLVIADEYALFRTDMLNVSVRKVEDVANSSAIRHVGWEDDSVKAVGEEVDVNGVIWELFSAQQQADEINAIWAEANYEIKH